MRSRNDREINHLRERNGPRKVIVIGAGITGLVAARELIKMGEKNHAPIEVIVLEAAPRIGGKIRTETIAGSIIETGPDSFVTLKPEMLELIEELGLKDQLIPTGKPATISILKNGKLVPMPSGMQLITPTQALPFAFSSLFSFKGKLRIALEPFIAPRRSQEDESLASFIRRRLGQEALNVLAAPMLAGIFAGDPEQMSVKSTFPQLLELEKRGGLAKGLWVTGKLPRKKYSGLSTFMTLKGGLSLVTERLASLLPENAIHTDCPATSIRRHEGVWEVTTPKGIFTADAIIAACAAPAFADAIENCDPEIAMRLREIPFASTATVSVVYDRAKIPSPPKGFGFLTMRSEGTTITAATYSSSKFPDRSVPGQVVIRAFVGGAGREESAEAAMMRIETRVREDLDRLLNLRGVTPIAAKTTRWIKANPQYNVGHSRRLERLESCLKSHPGLVLAGCSYWGVGLSDCVGSGKKAANMAIVKGQRRIHESVPAGLA